jgi:hypothetical protein
VLHCTGQALAPAAARAELDILTRGSAGGRDRGGYNLLVRLGKTTPPVTLHHLGETEILSEDGGHISVKLTPKVGLTHFGLAQIPDAGSLPAGGYGTPGVLAVDLGARRALLPFREKAGGDEIVIALVCFSP